MDNKVEVDKAGVPYLFRYRNNNKFTIDEISNNYIFFPNSEKLNDPFDASHKLLDINDDFDNIEKSYNYLNSKLVDNKIKNYFEEKFKNKIAFKDFLKSSIIEYINKTGIACFSNSQLNFMMWANYANNHQGICIQYNIKYDKEFFKGCRIVDYVEDLKQINYLIYKNEEEILNLFYMKLKLWKEEYEIRLIKNTTGKHNLNPKSIRSIIFGLRTSVNYKKKIIKAVKDNNSQIKVYDSQLLQTGFGLSLTEIEI